MCSLLSEFVDYSNSIDFNQENDFTEHQIPQNELDSKLPNIFTELCKLLNKLCTPQSKTNKEFLDEFTSLLLECNQIQKDEMLPILNVIQRNLQVNTYKEFSEELAKYSNLIESFQKIDFSILNSKHDLALLIKSIPKWTYEAVSSGMNMSRDINSLIETINKSQRYFYRNNVLHKEGSYISFCSKLRGESYDINSIQKSIEEQWAEQFQQSFYYTTEDSEFISKWMMRMMRDKTSFWFDQITYDKIRNDYKEVKQCYIHYAEEKKKQGSMKNKERRISGLSKRQRDDSSNTLSEMDQKEDKASEYLATLSPETKLISNRKFTENIETTQSLRFESGKCDSDNNLANPRLIDRSSVNTLNRSKFASKIDKSPRSGLGEFRIFDEYFGSNENDERSQAIDLKSLSEAFQTDVCMTDIEAKEDESLYSKTFEESSLTASTKVPGNNDSNSGDLNTVDCLLSNTFIKLSDFTDMLGKKLIFTVDWNYMCRHWHLSHTYIKDTLLEMLFAFSLHEEVIEDDNQESMNKGKDVQIKSTIEKRVSNNNILQHLMKRGFNINPEEIVNLNDGSYIESKSIINIQNEEQNL